jgi:hypothetical protein
MRAKDRSGRRLEWLGETAFGQGCTESNPLQQTWFVPHDIYGLIDLMGKDRFVATLEDMFEKTPNTFGWNPYYNHSNEPVHHVPYLFVYAGQPWLTQKWVRRILEQAYHAEVNGICGNDDVGQMSAWYVMSALGFYPVCPGDNVYVLGSPLFGKAVIRLDSKWHRGTTFAIVAHGNSSANCYIQSARLNGKQLQRAWITLQRSRPVECWSSLWGQSRTSNGEHQRESLPGCFLQSEQNWLRSKERFDLAPAIHGAIHLRSGLARSRAPSFNPALRLLYKTAGLVVVERASDNTRCHRKHARQSTSSMFSHANIV